MEAFVKYTENWNFRKLTKFFIVFGILIALVTSYFWYSQLYMTPERRFWTAINNSMATPSVVRTLTEGGTGNLVVQDFRFHYGPQKVVENKVVYTEKSAVTDTSVETQGIVYPDTQYLRYTQFSDSRNGGQGSNIDDLIGDWAIQAAEDREEARISFLSEQVSLVIFGNFSADLRNQMLTTMQEQSVYGDMLDTVLEDVVDGQEVYIYSANVKLKIYAQLLGDAFITAGYGEFPPLNPDNYNDDSAVNSTILVSKKDNSIVGISFGGRQETYSNYGVQKQIEQPQAVRTVQELQTEVQKQIQ